MEVGTDIGIDEEGGGVISTGGWGGGREGLVEK